MLCKAINLIHSASQKNLIIKLFNGRPFFALFREKAFATGVMPKKL